MKTKYDYILAAINRFRSGLVKHTRTNIFGQEMPPWEYIRKLESLGAQMYRFT